MRIENQYGFYLNKWIKYCSKKEAYDYRNKIQKLIDDENLNKIVTVDVVDYGDDRFSIYLTSGGRMDYIGSKSDAFILYRNADNKIKQILDAVGLSDKIES